MQLEIEVRAERGQHVVIPRGEIDLVSQSQLKDVINELVVAGHVHIVLDLDETTFLDSTGLGAMIGARRKTHAFRGSFALVCTQERLLKLFRITSLDKVFTFHDSLAEALAAGGAPDDRVDLPDGQPA